MTFAEAKRSITKKGYHVIATTTYPDGISYDALRGSGRAGKLVHGRREATPTLAMTALAWRVINTRL